MAKKTAKKAGKKTAKKTGPAKKRTPAKKKTAAKKRAPSKANKLGVKNSLVNNINARKKKGITRPKKKSKVSKKSYSRMKQNWK